MRPDPFLARAHPVHPSHESPVKSLPPQSQMKSPIGRVGCCIGALLALIPVSALAQTRNPKLLFTENSDTSLTATLDGSAFGTVTNVAPDHWEWRSGVLGDLISSNGFNGWTEPGNSLAVNFAQGTFFDQSPNTVLGDIGYDLYSDVSITFPNPSGPTNGGYGFTFTGDSGGNQVLGPIDVYFSDLGDSAASAPDNASTFVLLSLSCAALAGFIRFRRVRSSGSAR